MIWHNIFRHLAANPIRARFLLQVDASPYAGVAQAAAGEDGEDPLVAAASASDMAPLLADLPVSVLYDLGLGHTMVSASAIEHLTGRDSPGCRAVRRWHSLVMVRQTRYHPAPAGDDGSTGADEFRRTRRCAEGRPSGRAPFDFGLGHEAPQVISRWRDGRAAVLVDGLRNVRANLALPAGDQDRAARQRTCSHYPGTALLTLPLAS